LFIEATREAFAWFLDTHVSFQQDKLLLGSSKPFFSS
jgi:hypothetical protein